MKEALLHYLWKHQHFDARRLRTTGGEPIEILHPGTLNHDAGPDFFNAKIRIGKTTWAGNVELHLESADWKKHKHHKDPVYDNVILHVVFDSGGATTSSRGRTIPTLELRRFIHPELLHHYQVLMNSTSWIPCNANGRKIGRLHLLNWQTRLVWERLHRKSDEFLTLFKQNKEDWQRAFYLFMATHFGFGKNNLPFQMLMRSIPQNMLFGAGKSVQQLEALLFGQSGLLDKMLKVEPYAGYLYRIYVGYKNDYKLEPISSSLWSFFRLRPSGFPHIRIAQFASWLANDMSWSRLLEVRQLTALKSPFTKLYSPFLEETKHYKKTIAKGVGMGEASIQYLLINAVLPALFAYGRQTQNEKVEYRVLDWLEAMPAEDNKIVRNWRKHHFTFPSAFASQAMIELKNNYCSHKKCLNCTIGNFVLQTNNHD
jgi:hypothetical protein